MIIKVNRFDFINLPYMEGYPYKALIEGPLIINTNNIVTIEKYFKYIDLDNYMENGFLINGVPAIIDIAPINDDKFENAVQKSEDSYNKLFELIIEAMGNENDRQNNKTIEYKW